MIDNDSTKIPHELKKITNKYLHASSGMIVLPGGTIVKQ